MDILDWIPESYVEEIVQGVENPLDRVRHINPEEIVTRGRVIIPEPLVGLHPGNPSHTVGVKVDEEEKEEELQDDTKAENEVKEGATGYT